MFTLQRLNVIRIVEEEFQKAELMAKGFKEIVEAEVKEIEEVVKKGKD